MKKVDKNKILEFVSKKVDKINEDVDFDDSKACMTHAQEEKSKRYGFSSMVLSRAIKEEIANELYFKNIKFIKDES